MIVFTPKCPLEGDISILERIIGQWKTKAGEQEHKQKSITWQFEIYLIQHDYKVHFLKCT